jgi:hypothetical protein
MFLPNRFFSGSHRHQGWSRAQSGNRDIVRARCVPITVTPEDLAKAVNEDGVDMGRARDLVELLIARAHEAAVERTLGL